MRLIKKMEKSAQAWSADNQQSKQKLCNLNQLLIQVAMLLFFFSVSTPRRGRAMEQVEPLSLIKGNGKRVSI